MAATIFSIGFPFPGDVVENIPYWSNRSLLDADIILFEPTFYKYQAYEHYLGLPSLTDHSSFYVSQHASHWRSELKDAYHNGKTIVLFMAKPSEVYRDTGKRTYNGTGRNRQTTRIVELFSSYAAIPFGFSVQARYGKEIVSNGSLKYLASYWSEYEELSPYEVTLTGEFTDTLLVTKTGRYTVGASMRSAKGTVLCVPPISYNEDEFTIRKEGSPDKWNQKAIQFGKRLAKVIAELDIAIRSELQETPAPEWSISDEYRLAEETNIEAVIEERAQQIALLQEQRRQSEDALAEVGKLRGLLYEQGKPLENVVTEALKLLGFDASRYVDGDSEFDSVFTSDEGRFLGEFEGKDSKAINIEKLSQLERNIQEDFAREEIVEHAKGVLFGNAYRLTPIAERADFFTAKCFTGAKRSNTILIRTPDLFPIARYLRENNDPDYALICRKALAASEGKIVEFPPLPTAE